MKADALKRTGERIAALLRQDKKAAVLLFAALGLLLVLLLTGGKGQSSAQPQPEPADTAAQTTQQELCTLLGAIRGVGRVQVMLQFASAGSTVYAENTDSTLQDGAGSGRKEKNNVVIIKSGQSESGLVVRKETPVVTGAAVVCEGGGDPVVRAQIVETVSALFRLKSNHISVMPM